MTIAGVEGLTSHVPPRVDRREPSDQVSGRTGVNNSTRAIVSASTGAGTMNMSSASPVYLKLPGRTSLVSGMVEHALARYT